MSVGTGSLAKYSMNFDESLAESRPKVNKFKTPLESSDGKRVVPIKEETPVEDESGQYTSMEGSSEVIAKRFGRKINVDNASSSDQTSPIKRGKEPHIERS